MCKHRRLFLIILVHVVYDKLSKLRRFSCARDWKFPAWHTLAGRRDCCFSDEGYGNWNRVLPVRSIQYRPVTFDSSGAAVCRLLYYCQEILPVVDALGYWSIDRFHGDGDPPVFANHVCSGSGYPIGDFGRRIRFDSEGNLFDKEIELLTSFNGYDILSKNRERTLKIFEFHCFSFVWVL